MAPITQISVPPWTVLGYRKDGRPVYAIAGGSDDAPGPDDTADDDAAADQEPADDWAPPSREEYEKLIADKRKADGEAAARRKYLRAHGIDPKTGEKVKPDTEPDDVETPAADPAQQGLSQAEVKRAVERAQAEAQLKGTRQMRTFTVGFNAALSEAGWNGSRLGSLMKLVDLDAVDIDDDGEITGLAEQIDDIKGEWPELFKRARNSAGSAKMDGSSGQNVTQAAKVDAADKPAPKPEPKGWAQQIAQRALRS